jgi:hypothetical protein
MCKIKPSPKGKCLIEWLIKELKASKAKSSKQKCGSMYNLKGENTLRGCQFIQKYVFLKYILYYFGSSFSLISYNILINM